MSYPKKPHEGYNPADEPVSEEARLALPKDLGCPPFGPDTIIRTTEPMKIDHPNKFQVNPAYEPPSEPLREEAKRLEEGLGVEWAYPGAGGSSINPDAPLNPFAEADVAPMSQWKPFIPQALVHGEFEKLEGWLTSWEKNLEETKALNERLKRGETVTLNLGGVAEGNFAPHPLALISEVRRLIARYKELWDIASGIVNSEDPKEDS